MQWNGCANAQKEERERCKYAEGMADPRKTELIVTAC